MGKKIQKPTAKVTKDEETKPEMVKIVVTQDYLDAHPDITGVEVGDEIEVEEAPAVVGTDPEPVKGGTVPKLPKGECYSILKNGEYIRTYDNKEDADAFCSKNAILGAHAVAESTVIAVVVEFDGKNADGSVKQEQKKFTVSSDGADFKKHAMVFRNSQKDAFAKAVLAEE